MAQHIAYRSGQDWLDTSTARRALDVQRGEQGLCLGGAGEIALALAAEGAGELICIHADPGPSALAELKWAAARSLKRTGICTLLGLNEAGRRVFLYHQLRTELGEASRSWWDRNEAIIRKGAIGQGDLESKLRQFRFALPLVHRHSLLEGLFSCSSIEEQRALYKERWNSVRWRALVRSWGRSLLGAASGHASLPTGSSAGLLSRISQQLESSQAAENPFLAGLLKGEDQQSALQLQEDTLESLQNSETSFSFLVGETGGLLETLPRDSFDFIHLGDTLDHCGSQEREHLLSLLHRAAKPGARLLHASFLREIPDLPDSILPMEGESRELGQHCRSFLHAGLRLYQAK
jgi:S-adenosylmethionine-diacylglycerol 3-amino-3-carboxypropyl transferase